VHPAEFHSSAAAAAAAAAAAQGVTKSIYRHQLNVAIDQIPVYEVNVEYVVACIRST
jgi:hypothetical protein